MVWLSGIWPRVGGGVGVGDFMGIQTESPWRALIGPKPQSVGPARPWHALDSCKLPAQSL